MANTEFLQGIRMAEIHMLKLYPASALNRDDAGEQKTAYYNGTLRNRISSQCMKRAYRTSEAFREAFTETGIRTKRMPAYVGSKLMENGVPQEIANTFMVILAGHEANWDSAKSPKKPKSMEQIEAGKPVLSPALAFYSEQELDAIVEICLKKYEALEEPKAKTCKKIKLDEIQAEMRKAAHPMTIDVAAFGRMVTDNMLRSVEGAMQFSQILSTNSAVKENDYFVACDDFVKGETAEDNGGAMLGDIDYDSACYYIHVVADLEQFAENLKDCENSEEIVRTLPSKFVEVMAYTDPSARQNTFEAHVLPEVICVELKAKKRPLNRMKAFAEPCNRNILKSSVEALANNFESVSEKADLGTINSVWYCEDEGFKAPENVTIVKSIMELQDVLNGWMGAQS